ncbi:MAG: SDR family oxidoreductase [Chlamydiia bacterium]|nr:SDR family oxidoreductase [Chlamydiia bacterium]
MPGRVLITGAGRRTGRALAEYLAAQGYDLILHYHNGEAEATQLADSLGGSAVYGDFGHAQGVSDFLRRVHALSAPIDAFIYTVGPYLQDSLLSIAEPDWRRLFELSVHAPLYLTRGLLPMRSVVMFGMTGLQRTDPKRSAYQAVKSAQWHMLRGLAKELAPARVRVNMLSPGYLENSIDLPGAFPPCSWGECVALDDVCRLTHTLLETEQLTGQNIEIAGGIGL